MAFTSVGQWERVYSFSEDDTTFYQDLHFFYADTGYVIVSRQTSDPLTQAEYIMRTVNGGVSFDTIQTYVDTNLVAISFPSREIGYIAYSSPATSSNIGVIKTTNGGDSWFTLPANGITQPHSLIGIHFYNDTIGMVSRNGYSWITYDGGYIWNQVNTNLNSGTHTTVLKDSIYAGTFGAVLYYTPDTSQNYISDTLEWGGSSVYLDYDEDVFYVAIEGNQGFLYDYPYFNFGIIAEYNPNLGLTSLYHLPYQRTRSIKKSGDHIYLGTRDLEGGAHRFLKSEDGGQTWWSQQIIEPQTPNTLGVRKIVCVNDTVCYGMDGSYLYKTTNGGGALVEQKGQAYVSIEELEEELMELLIYPNPAQDILNITTDEKIEQVQVVNLSGKILLTVAEGNTAIDVGHLKSGVYLVKIQTAKNSFIRKFEKE